MFTFNFVYSDGSTKQRNFESVQSGVAWAFAEGDHLISYDYSGAETYEFWMEYHNGDWVHIKFKTLKEGFDYIYSIGDKHILNYGYNVIK
jgi:hypothetical protein